MTINEEMTADFIGLGLSIDRNPLTLARPMLDGAGVLRAAEFSQHAHPGTRARVAGMVIIRQRPATAKGMVFITLEDETGLANLVITPDVYERLRPVARDEPLVIAAGKVERQGRVVNLRVDDMTRLPPPPDTPTVPARNFR